MSQSVFSQKLLVMLGNALEDVLKENSGSIEDLVKAYTLPSLLQSLPDFHDIMMTGKEYVRHISNGRIGHVETVTNVTRLIEAIHKELTTDAPAALRNRIHWESGGFGKPHRTNTGSVSYQAFLRQLNAEGLILKSGKLVFADSEAPAEYKDRTALAATIRGYTELSPSVLIHHIEQSDSTYANQNWHATTNEARSFLEGLIVHIAIAEAANREESILNYPVDGERRSNFGPCRAYLLSCGFTDKGEDTLIREFYSVLSVEGGHPGITEEDIATLTRRYCWITGHYILAKYETWKRNGHKF